MLPFDPEFDLRPTSLACPFCLRAGGLLEVQGSGDAFPLLDIDGNLRRELGMLLFVNSSQPSSALHWYCLLCQQEVYSLSQISAVNDSLNFSERLAMGYSDLKNEGDYLQRRQREAAQDLEEAEMGLEEAESEVARARDNLDEADDELRVVNTEIERIEERQTALLKHARQIDIGVDLTAITQAA